jgi:hypothetical protein
MPTEKAAMFVDNSNIFQGMYTYSGQLRKAGRLRSGQYLRVRWDKLVALLESQDGGLDIYARHFFASLPPAADVSRLKHRPTEDQWEEMVKKSAQSGFYRVIQDPPFNFTLHGIPLRFSEVKCRLRMRQAYFKCLNAYAGKLGCSVSVNPDECYACKKQFLHKYEKGVDVALASQLVIFGGIKGAGLNRVILVAGDGDYREAVRFVRREVGKDVQIVSWRMALSKELEKLANKPTMILDDIWETVCQVRKKPPLDEIPAGDEDEAQGEGENQ